MGYLFETKRCLINTFQKFDYDEVKLLYMNQEVRNFLGGIREEDSIIEVLNEMLHSNADSYYWVVREKRTEAFIGLVSLTPHHDGLYLEVSYQFLPNWWGAGFATEVVQEIINFAIYELKLTKVVAETQTANISSCKLLEKLGMKLERKVIRFGAEQAIYSFDSNVVTNF